MFSMHSFATDKPEEWDKKEKKTEKRIKQIFSEISVMEWLVYILENYFHPERAPENDQIQKYWSGWSKAL